MDIMKKLNLKEKNNMATRSEIKRWDDHLAKQRKELGIKTFRHKNENGLGSFRIESDLGKCKICNTETPYILFLDKYNQGTGVCVCPKCLRNAATVIEKQRGGSNQNGR
jgi:ribosome biogenesis GTPase A